jgi:hypothetical protein
MILRDQTHRAARRRRRRCGLCGRRIRAGDLVRDYAVADEGTVATYCEHAVCADYADEEDYVHGVRYPLREDTRDGRLLEALRELRGDRRRAQERSA